MTFMKEFNEVCLLNQYCLIAQAVLVAFPSQTACFFRPLSGPDPDVGQCLDSS